MFMQVGDFLGDNFPWFFLGFLALSAWGIWTAFKKSQKNHATSQKVETALQEIRFELYPMNSGPSRMQFEDRRDDSRFKLLCGLGVPLNIHFVQILFVFSAHGIFEPDAQICNAIHVSGGKQELKKYSMKEIEDAKRDFVDRVKEVI